MPALLLLWLLLSQITEVVKKTFKKSLLSLVKHGMWLHKLAQLRGCDRQMEMDMSLKLAFLTENS